MKVRKKKTEAVLRDEVLFVGIDHLTKKTVNH